VSGENSGGFLLGSIEGGADVSEQSHWTVVPFFALSVAFIFDLNHRMFNLEAATPSGEN